MDPSTGPECAIGDAEIPGVQQEAVDAVDLPGVDVEDEEHLPPQHVKNHCEDGNDAAVLASAMQTLRAPSSATQISSAHKRHANVGKSAMMPQRLRAPHKH